MVKNVPANAGDPRDIGSAPGSGRFPGGGNAIHQCSVQDGRGATSGEL